jgi:hypothetical protein
MRFCLVAAVLLSSVGWAQDPPVTSPATDAPKVEPSLDPRGVVDALPPLVFLPDGKLAPGRSVKLGKFDQAPFAGWLVDHQEHTRREKRDAGNAAALATYEDPGSITQSRAQFIVLVTGVALAGIAAGAAVTGGVLELLKPKPTP